MTILDNLKSFIQNYGRTNIPPEIDTETGVETYYQLPEGINTLSQAMYELENVQIRIEESKN